MWHEGQGVMGREVHRMNRYSVMKMRLTSCPRRTDYGRKGGACPVSGPNGPCNKEGLISRAGKGRRRHGSRSRHKNGKCKWNGV